MYVPQCLFHFNWFVDEAEKSITPRLGPGPESNGGLLCNWLSDEDPLSTDVGHSTSRSYSSLSRTPWPSCGLQKELCIRRRAFEFSHRQWPGPESNGGSLHEQLGWQHIDSKQMWATPPPGLISTISHLWVLQLWGLYWRTRQKMNIPNRTGSSARISTSALRTGIFCIFFLQLRPLVQSRCNPFHLPVFFLNLFSLVWVCISRHKNWLQIIPPD
jgi:hypothetical protein